MSPAEEEKSVEMARYTGPSCHRCRRLGEKLMLKGDKCSSPKCPLEKKSAASAGQRNLQFKRRRRVSDRGLRLLAKQKVRFSYGVLERQFRITFNRAAKQPGVTGDNLFMLLERRLDNIAYRLGFASSRPQARQLVMHGHILVDGHRVDIPSFVVTPGNVITWRGKSKQTEYYKSLLEENKGRTIPEWLCLDEENMAGTVTTLPGKDDLEARFDSKAIVEYYSR